MVNHPVVIVGSGIIGLTIAYYLKNLPNPPHVTIVAREIPRRASENGDDWVTGQWASPWAGAIYAADETQEDEEVQKIEIESYRHFWKIAHEDPTSGIQIRPMHQYYDESSVPDPTKMWLHTFVHNYRQLREEELPIPRRGITGGIEYLSMSINPWVFLPWLRSKLEIMGVDFVQGSVTSLKNAANFAPYNKNNNISPIVVNATGLGSEILEDVKDSAVESVRGQTMWVHCDYTGPMAIRHGHEYTYFIPRAFSQGAIFGGVSQPGNLSTAVDSEVKYDILSRVRDLVPDAYKAALTIPINSIPASIKPASTFEGLRILKDIVGFRPGRVGGFRLEVERNSTSGTPVIHAYGFEGHGYISSGGVAQVVARAVQHIASERNKDSRL